MYHSGRMPQTSGDAISCSSSLNEMIARHALLEAQCDRAIEQQEQLLRQQYRPFQCIDENLPYTGEMQAGELHPGSVVLEDGTAQERNITRISDLSRKTATTLMKAVRERLRTHLPNGARRAVLNCYSFDARKINELEDTISIYRYTMGDVEEDILDYVPVNSQDCIAKLTFLSGLLMDGRQFEQHDLGYFLDEISATLHRAAVARSIQM